MRAALYWHWTQTHDCHAKMTEQKGVEASQERAASPWEKLVEIQKKTCEKYQVQSEIMCRTVQEEVERELLKEQTCSVVPHPIDEWKRLGADVAEFGLQSNGVWQALSCLVGPQCGNSDRRQLFFGHRIKRRRQQHGHHAGACHGLH